MTQAAAARRGSFGCGCDHTPSSLGNQRIANFLMIPGFAGSWDRWAMVNRIELLAKSDTNHSGSRPPVETLIGSKADMKIVCGTDFSVYAANAANVATALAKRDNAPLKLIHGVAPARVEFLSKENVDHIRKHLRRKLAIEANRLRKMGAEVLENLALGHPPEMLAQAAESSKADLIIVSSIGQFAPSRWLIGSVAEKTAQLAKVPTLVVRDHESLLDWVKRKRTLKVFVGYDFSTSSDSAPHWVASLRNIGECRVTVAYVSWPPQETWRLGIGGHAPLANNPPEVQELLERDLAERCHPAFGKNKPKLRVVSSWGPIEERLVELVEAEGADLMVVGTNQRQGLNRFWLGSVSRGVLHNTSMNVACVPAMPKPPSIQNQIPTYRQVLAPTDFSKQGNGAIAFAYGAAPQGGEVCLVHVVRPLGGFRSRTEAEAALDTKRKRELAARLESLIPKDAWRRGIRSKVEIVEHEHPATAICQAAERYSANLICIGSHGRSGLKKKLLGSVAEAVMRRSSRPVLVIRPPG